MGSLTNKVAIVTGGSRGIGSCVARAFLAEGLQVSITGRRADDLARAREKLEGSEAETIETFAADVRHYAEMERVIAGTVSRFGGLDVLVNNAGVGVFATWPTCRRNNGPMSSTPI